jgi:hypothetical protein
MKKKEQRSKNNHYFGLFAKVGIAFLLVGPFQYKTFFLNRLKIEDSKL